MPNVKISMAPSPGVILRRAASTITPTLAKALLKAATIASGFIMVEVRNRHPGGTGNLAGSFKATFVDTPKGVSAGALSDLPYARIQNEGGTILPKGKMLAVPVTPKAEKLWPRDWGENKLDLVVNKKKNQALLIEKATDQLQYVLKASVTIKGKRYLEAAARKVETEMPKQVMADIAAEMKKAVEGSGG